MQQQRIPPETSSSERSDDGVKPRPEPRARRRVTISIATKLLMGVFLLVALTVGFLNFSAIVLVTEDKRAYLFQSQANETFLLGKDFSGTLRRAVDALRLVLGTGVTGRELTPAQRLTAQASIDNQSTVLGVRLGKLNVPGKLFRWEEGWLHTTLAPSAGFTDADLALDPEQLQSYAPILAERGIALVNVSQVGKAPLVAVLYADRSATVNGLVPVAVGFFSLASFGGELRGNRLTIASLGGETLFDTDSAIMVSKSGMQGDPLFDFATRERVDTGAREYESTEGRFLGSYYRPGFDVVVMSRVSWDEAMAATYTLTEKFILLGLMALSATVFFSVVFAKRLTAPINRLYEATRSVAEGNFNVELQSVGRDEIGVLTDSFVAMSKKIDELIIESMRKVQLENELAIASTVQQTLIPPPQVDTNQVRIRSLYRSAAECGGDWWGFFSKGQSTYCMIADATGHGLPSALITAAAQSCLSVLSKLAIEIPGWNPTPGDMLAIANRAIFGAGNGKINMTFFIAELNFASQEIVFASAGHNPAWLFRPSPQGFTQKSLVAHGDRLGEQRDVPKFQEQRMPFQRGDILFLYTDGMLEAKGPESEEMFGKKRAAQILQKSISEGPAAMIADLEQAVMLFNGDKPLDDDVTLVAVQTV